MKAELEKRGLKTRVDTSTNDDIHVAAFKSYHTTTPNGYNLQMSDLTHDTRVDSGERGQTEIPGRSLNRGGSPTTGISEYISMPSSVSRDWRALGVVQPSRAVCDTAVQSELREIRSFRKVRRRPAIQTP